MQSTRVPDIVLTTLNAKFIHTAFGLRYLHANLGGLRGLAVIREFEIKQRPLEIVEQILAEEPKIVGLGVYIWNAAPAREVASLLKKLRPELILVLGGPEVSHEIDVQPICALADYVITGEADFAFAGLCREVLSGDRPGQRVITPSFPDVTGLASPYSLYSQDDIEHRIIYVEASRGCPFRCEFCLSSLEIPVRQFPLEQFLMDLDLLVKRGARQFKFVDRTFNLSIPTSSAILRFFLERIELGLFLHFEMVPDRLPTELRELIRQFPAGSLQLEVGVQTFHPEVASRISRRQNYKHLEDNLRFLAEDTSVHVHADLIAGLPGESLESFAEWFDRLMSLGPQEIQVGILKRLRGTPICRHDAEWAVVYSPEAPYEILRNRLIDFPTMQRLRRFARYWDIFHNSGTFRASMPLLLSGSASFRRFMAFSDWLYARTKRTAAISLTNRFELLYEYLTTELQQDSSQVAAKLMADHRHAGRTDTPRFLREHAAATNDAKVVLRATPKRQARHLRAEEPVTER